MDRKRKGVLVANLVVILGAAGFFVFSQTVGPSFSVGPCTSSVFFTALPANLSKVKNIVPLGNLNPPSHTYPTDHMYFYSDNDMGFEVFAPGDILITQISEVTYSNYSIRSYSSDYTIDFQVCTYVSGRFGHINNISADIWSLIGRFGEAYGDIVDSWQVADDNVTAYRKHLMLRGSSGSLLGIAGVSGGALDFWLKDQRVSLDFVNPDHTREYQYTVCPLQFFTLDLRDQMSAKLGDWMGNPVYPNASYCGRVAFDVYGAAQGIWTVEWHEEYTSLRPEDMGLALVYSNFNASMGTISVGAIHKGWDSQVYYFNPSDTGVRNRVFNEVTADGTVYWYQFYDNTFWPPSKIVEDKCILLKMINDTALMIQFIDNKGDPIYGDPTALWNESETVLFVR
ncbi:MAG: hypothetical protein ACTSYO_00890 [Candidatus Ranarchaeia archaeon]